MQDLSIELRNQ